MKKLKARELVWMTLPVALLGGTAWWFDSQAKLRSGPPRLLPLRWERVPVDAADVARGYEFTVKTRVHMVGEVERPKGFARFMPNYNIDRQTFHLQYRDTQGWQEARLPEKGLPLTFILGHDEDLTMQFRLASVPHDAQEVRARGLFSVEEAFASAFVLETAFQILQTLQSWPGTVSRVVRVGATTVRHFYQRARRTFFCSSCVTRANN